MKFIIKIFLFICFAFLLIYNITLIVQKAKNPSETPDFLGYKNFIILSGSMENALNVGDAIFVKENSEIQKGDIISYRENQAVVTHRVVDIIEQNGETFYQTKGDANKAVDTNNVSIDKIEGKYCFKIPKVGTIIMFFQSKTGVVTFLIVLLLIYFLTDISSNKNIFGKKGKHSL